MHEPIDERVVGPRPHPEKREMPEHHEHDRQTPYSVECGYMPESGNRRLS